MKAVWPSHMKRSAFSVRLGLQSVVDDDEVAGRYSENSKIYQVCYKADPPSYKMAGLGGFGILEWFGYPSVCWPFFRAHSCFMLSNAI